MGTLLSIHANGGYDVVREGDDDEGEYMEFVGFALTPTQLMNVQNRHLAAGARVVDYRSPEKRALALTSKLALENLQNLEAAALNGYVERECLIRARNYALACEKLAQETSC